MVMRAVMEAVTAVLGGELHVGVLLQGKKIRDDNRTIQQTGISVNSDTLGFMLEPSLPQPSQSLVQNESPLLLPCDNHQPLASSPASPVADAGFLNASVDLPQSISLDNQAENNKESKPVTTEVLTEDILEDTKAIVPVTPLNPEALLGVVPSNHKLTKRSELSQRRTRRPFSVSEVEALVEAVETLGTGRWRDVKIRAFDIANHRTYVDLKDKWKTLVHTASISPQQISNKALEYQIVGGDRSEEFDEEHAEISSLPNGSKFAGPNDQRYPRQVAGFWGYTFQIIFQAGTVVLTDCVFWFIIVPFLAIKDYNLNFFIINMHSINAVFLLGDTALNSMRFPWFRIAYFVLWTCVFVAFQWIVHACIYIWWPYPFLDLSSPFSPLWYLSVALLQVPCYGIFVLVIKLKHFLLSKLLL